MIAELATAGLLNFNQGSFSRDRDVETTNYSLNYSQTRDRERDRDDFRFLRDRDRDYDFNFVRPYGLSVDQYQYLDGRHRRHLRRDRDRIEIVIEVFSNGRWCDQSVSPVYGVY